MKPTPMASASSIADHTALRAAKDSARASTRQLVTISGRKIPSPAWIAGNQAASVSSTAVTAAAMTTTNTAMRTSGSSQRPIRAASVLLIRSTAIVASPSPRP